MARFKKIAIASKEGSPASKDYLRDLVPVLEDWAKTKKVSIFIEGRKSQGNRAPLPELLKKSDLVLAVGGDGTILRCARHLLEGNLWKKTTVLGINLGRLGFLSSLSGAESLQQIRTWFDDKTKTHVEERSALSIKIKRSGRVLKEFHALNDGVLTRSGISRLMEVEAKLDGHRLGVYRADGLIMNTPTGSTAYNLAAGGAVMSPLLEAFQLTPICSQSPSVHPLVFGESSQVLLKVRSDSLKVQLTVDGHASTDLKEADEIELKKSPKSIRLWLPESSSHANFVNSLQQKLNWGLVSFSGRANL